MKKVISNIFNHFLKWKNFDYSKFFKEINYRLILFLIIICFLFILFQYAIQNLILKYLVSGFLDNFNTSIIANYITYVFCLIAILFFLYNLILKHKIPSINSICFSLAYIFVSIYLLNSFKDIEPLNIKFGIFVNKPFFHVLSFSALFFLLEYKPFFTPLNKPYSKYFLHDDNSNVDQYKDLYSREDFAKYIEKFISNTTTISSFGIGITGAWGSGKSDFLNRLSKVLEQENENVIVNFNPWKFGHTENMTSYFLDQLSDSLKPFSQTIDKKLMYYSEAILKPARETPLKMLYALFNKIVSGDKTHVKNYNDLESSIDAIQKRIVVFIDDLDRLTGVEILEIFKIIRNISNFKNTFFIVSFDIEYVNLALKKLDKISREGEYFKKIFQLIIPLPSVESGKIANELERLLLTTDLKENEINEISTVLYNIGIKESKDQKYEAYILSQQYDIHKTIRTLRDVKRFVNSFKITYSLLKEHVDIFDLFILEVIKCVDVSLYNSIRELEFLNIEKEGDFSYFRLNNEDWNNFTKNKSIAHLKLFNEINLLFYPNPIHRPREIRSLRNFQLYFSYSTKNNLDYSFFNKVMKSDQEVIYEYFVYIISIGQQEELYELIQNHFSQRPFKQFENLIITLLQVSDFDLKWYKKAVNLYYSGWIPNLNKYFNNNKKKQINHLISILKKKNITPFWQARFGDEYIRRSKDPNNSEFSGSNFADVIYDEMLNLFTIHLYNYPTNHEQTRWMYTMNKWEKENNIYSIDKKPSSYYREYLEKNDEGFIGFIEIIFHFRTTPYNESFALFGFLKDIYPDLNLFYSRVKNVIINDEKVDRIRKILLSVWDQYKPKENLIMIYNEEDRIFLENVIKNRKELN